MNAHQRLEKYLPIEFSFKHPSSEDGHRVHKLVQNSPPLDQNSLYCNLLQCSHFASTSIAAFLGDEMVGFISGYIKPHSHGEPKTLFVWQVMVAEVARGQGLASRMLEQLITSDAVNGVMFVETTITANNAGSWALFEKLAGSLNADFKKSPLFDKNAHFKQKHDTEILMRIGPLRKHD